jgi:PKHD-type hydroxylase
MDQTRWLDGRVTAGPQSERVKHNLIAEGSPERGEWGTGPCCAFIMLFVSAALPRRIFPPLFSAMRRHGVCPHIDNALRGGGDPVHTDISATLF